MTQEDLAVFLGMESQKRSTVASWETMNTMPSPEIILKLMALAKCSYEDLLTKELDFTGHVPPTETNIPSLEPAPKIHKKRKSDTNDPEIKELLLSLHGKVDALTQEWEAMKEMKKEIDRFTESVDDWKMGLLKITDELRAGGGELAALISGLDAKVNLTPPENKKES